MTSSRFRTVPIVQIKASSVDEQTLIDEWCRQFYMEGRRRSDLVRFGLFTGSKYLWSFKGGVI